MNEVPSEVTGIKERPVVVAAPMPTVFWEIIKNDRRRGELLNMRGAMTREQWHELRELTHYKRDSLRPGAEQALRWNVDKGNPQPR